MDKSSPASLKKSAVSKENLELTKTHIVVKEGHVRASKACLEKTLSLGILFTGSSESDELKYNLSLRANDEILLKLIEKKLLQSK